MVPWQVRERYKSHGPADGAGRERVDLRVLQRSFIKKTKGGRQESQESLEGFDRQRRKCGEEDRAAGADKRVGSGMYCLWKAIEEELDLLQRGLHIEARAGRREGVFLKIF